MSDIAQQLDLSKTTVHRLLQSLKVLGYVDQEHDTDHYHLTMRMFELGAKALENTDLIKEADSIMREIGKATRETVHLGTLDEDTIVYIHKIDSEYGLRMASRIGGRNPIYSTAIGKVLLAWMPEAQSSKIARSLNYKKSTDNTLANADELIALLPVVKQQGFGEDREEQENGLYCIAVPIFDRFGRVIAGLSISFPLARCDDEHTKAEYTALLKAGSEKLSAKLGYHM